MPRSNNVVTDFSGGEISPRILGRVDAPIYRKSCEEITNWIVRPQGGVQMRAGMESITRLSSTTTHSRLIPVRNGGSVDDIYIQLLFDTALGFEQAILWVAGVSVIAITVPYDAADFGDIQYAQRGSLIGLTHDDYPPAFFSVDIVSTPSTIVYSQVSVGLIPVNLFGDLLSPSGSASIWNMDFIDTAPSGAWLAGDLYSLDLDGVTIEKAGVSGINASLEAFYPADLPRSAMLMEQHISSDPRFTGFEVSVLPTAGPVLPLVLTVSGPHAEGTWEGSRIGNPFGGGQTDPAALVTSLITQGESTLEAAWSYPTWVLFSGNYYQARAENVNSQPNLNPSDWTNLGASEPDGFAWQYPSGNAWNNSETYVVGDRGFPRCCIFHQQRFVVGGTKDIPGGFWGSRIGNFIHFIAGPADNDAYAFEVDNEDNAKIQYLVVNQGILIGTSSGDFIATGAPITPSQIDVTRQTGRRSALVRPVTIGSDTFYVEQGLEKMRKLIRDRNTVAFTTSDVTLIAEHLGRKGIVRLAIMFVPETVIWAVTADGDLISCSYEQELGMSPWSRHETDGDVLDLITVYEGNRDVLYVTANRARVSGSVLSNERMEYPDFDSVFLDEYDYQSGAATDVFAVIWLGNQTVRAVGRKVIGQGEPFYLGEFIADASGQITVSVPVAEIWIGRAYIPRLITTEQVGDGSWMPTKRRWNKLFVRMFDSTPPMINGERVPERMPSDPMDQGPNLRPRDVSVNLLGHGDGRLTIEQDIPLRTEIVGLYGEMSADNA